MILIAENMTNAKLAYCIQTIAFRLNAGRPSSLRQYPKVFEPIAIGLIEAGEAGGILEQVLDRIALLLEERAKIRGSNRFNLSSIGLAGCCQPGPTYFHRSKIQRYV